MKWKTRKYFICLALLMTIGCNEKPQKIKNITIPKSLLNEDSKSIKQKSVQTENKYEGLYLGMSKSEALEYIRYEEISYRQISSLGELYGKDNVSRDNAYELGLPHQFFLDMYHFDFREKSFDIISLSFTNEDDKLWKIKISYGVPERKEDQHALEIALKEKFKVKTVERGITASFKHMSVVLFDEKLASRNLRTKKEDYLSEL